MVNNLQQGWQIVPVKLLTDNTVLSDNIEPDGMLFKRAGIGKYSQQNFINIVKSHQ